jgi:hypothetical protein
MRNVVRQTAKVLGLGTLFVSACFAAVVAGNHVGGASATPSFQFEGREVIAAPAPACSERVLEEAKEVLGIPDSTRWFWADIEPQGVFGLAWYDSQTVALATTLPCELVFSTVAHEYAHLVITEDMGWTGETPTEEIVADCVSALLRATHGGHHGGHTPYLTERGCAPVHLTAAKTVISENMGL